MKITLDNRDTESVHIDTYSMFTGEMHEEYERDSMREDGRKDWETVGIEYNHKAIVNDFAHASINYLIHELIIDDIKIVNSITLESSGSPKYYNYTTDYYVAVYDCNESELRKYIASNYDAIIEKVRTYNSVYSYTPISDIDDEDILHAGLCHYINSVIVPDDYNMALWERESEIYYENATVLESK